MPEWSLVYEGYEPTTEGLREALCALGNGYFVAGREIENEDLVNLPNWLPLSIRIGEGEWLSPDRVELLDYRQELDLFGGVLLRTLRWRDGAGRITRWQERRLVSMAGPVSRGQ